ncbi:fasciclin domain-containing protein [Celeribacter sp.]|uniref:fasciclin domain-containing protein n=1 Tax=Celeribacter sp. TaxID=1890673 RepID=UPI003A8FC79A
MKTRNAFLALSTAVAMTAAPLSAEIINGEYLDENATVTENAMKISNLSTLVEAVKTAGLADDLMGDGPLTVFAPTDAAFADLPEGALDSLMQPENRDDLIAVLGTHVVEGEYTTAHMRELMNGEADPDANAFVDEDMLTLTTLSGTKIRIDGGVTDQIVVSGAASQVITSIEEDMAQGNGVMHVIDGVIMPVM